MWAKDRAKLAQSATSVRSRSKDIHDSYCSSEGRAHRGPSSNILTGGVLPRQCQHLRGRGGMVPATRRFPNSGCVPPVNDHALDPAPKHELICHTDARDMALARPA